MAPLTTSDLIFSEQANRNFSQTLGELKRSTLSIQNRLRSIEEDATFPKTVQEAYERPLIANERCGSWYIRPSDKSGSAYFKSTDGHTGVWKFSSRRLNLHLLEGIGKSDGCIIVDSTRRGKRMPDALSKTIPIWCSVLNRVLFPTESKFHDLYTPPQVVSASEHAQILALVPSFEHALQALDVPLEALRCNITKPLRPMWLTPDSDITPATSIFDDFHPIICCTVSRRVTGSEASEGGYIQGAADDTENWAYGLTPTIFWPHRQRLMSTSEGDLPDLIKILVEHASKDGAIGESLRLIKPTSNLFVSHIGGLGTASVDANDLTIALLPVLTEPATWNTSSKRLDVGIGQHKVGSRSLRSALPIIIQFIQGNISGKEGLEFRIVIACESGEEFSIGVALALLCLFFDNEGELIEKSNSLRLDKAFIRGRLGWISTSMPDANPNRATLQSVNSFLMERPK